MTEVYEEEFSDREIQALLKQANDLQEIIEHQIYLDTISAVTAQRDAVLQAEHESRVAKKIRNGAAVTALALTLGVSMTPGFKHESVKGRLGIEGSVAIYGLMIAGVSQALRFESARNRRRAALEARRLNKSINRQEDGWIEEELGPEKSLELSLSPAD